MIVGQGFVGLKLAELGVRAGHTILGIDVDEVKRDRIAKGGSDADVVSASALQEMHASGRYRIAARPNADTVVDIFVIATPTPLVDGRPDISSIRESMAMISEYVRPGNLIILESTTYPGTTREVVCEGLLRAPHLESADDVFVAYSPERINPGARDIDVDGVPKLVAGRDAQSLENAKAFYESMFSQTHLLSTLEAAEFTKLIENSFRLVNIAFINEIAELSAELGLDIWELLTAAQTKPYGWMRFDPGSGAGGHCIPVDPGYLIWAASTKGLAGSRLVSDALAANRATPMRVAARIVHFLECEKLSVVDARIVIVGITYKANVSDLRESTAVSVARALRDHGARVSVADPILEGSSSDIGFPRVDVSESVLKDADLVVVAVNHDAVDYAEISRWARRVVYCGPRPHGLAQGVSVYAPEGALDNGAVAVRDGDQA
jgi:nucleotide sugar dehydrogenase